MLITPKVLARDTVDEWMVDTLAGFGRSASAWIPLLGGPSRLPRVRPARSGGIGFLAFRFSLQDSWPFVRLREFAPNDHQGKRHSQWQEIDGEYRQRLVPAIMSPARINALTLMATSSGSPHAR